MRTRRVIFAFYVWLAMLMVGASGALAHQSPSGCNSNNLDLNLSQSDSLVRPGDPITYTVSIGNLDSGPLIACDVTGATVTFRAPDQSGVPGSSSTLQSGIAVPAGTPFTVVGTVNLTVNVSPGIESFMAEASINGTVHLSPSDDVASVTKTITAQVTQPSAVLVKDAAPTTGRAPRVVNYTYSLTNNSSTPVPMREVAVTDDLCSPVTFTGGDGNVNNLLDNGETWTFTCSRTFTAPGTFTNTATAAAVSDVDDLPVPIPPDTATIVVTAPHAVLTKTSSPSSGSPPLNVTFTYTLRNDGTDPIDDVNVADSNCSPLVRVSGDGNNNNILDLGEIWTYTCSRTFSQSGTFPNVVVATGTSTTDDLPVPIEPATHQVILTAPPPVQVTTSQGAPPIPETGVDLPVLPSLMLSIGLIALGRFLKAPLTNDAYVVVAYRPRRRARRWGR